MVKNRQRILLATAGYSGGLPFGGAGAIDSDANAGNVGERTNVTGSARFKRLIKKRIRRR